MAVVILRWSSLRMSPSLVTAGEQFSVLAPKRRLRLDTKKIWHRGYILLKDAASS